MVQFGQFDSITGLGAGDKIDLPADIHSVMQHGAWGGDEASLILMWNSPNLPHGSGSIDIYTIGADAYLMCDATGLGVVDVNSDLFIKVVGGAGLNFSSILI
jgi:hypothetical protein